MRGWLYGICRNVVYRHLRARTRAEQEVAQALGVSLDTVYSRLSLARKQFETYLRRLPWGIGATLG